MVNFSKWQKCNFLVAKLSKEIFKKLDCQILLVVSQKHKRIFHQFFTFIFVIAKFG
jgi:hypothetical protein